MKGVLGADIFANMLLVFIIMTGTLLMNANARQIREELSEGQQANGAQEMVLPEVQLPSANTKGKTAGIKSHAVSISVQKTEKAIQCFVNEKKIILKDLAQTLKEVKPRAAEIRIDHNIPYGTYISILASCKEAGIDQIFNVYTN